MPLGEQQCGEVAADSTEIAGRSGHKDRAVICRFHRHIAYLMNDCVQIGWGRSVFGVFYGLIVTGQDTYLYREETNCGWATGMGAKRPSIVCLAKVRFGSMLSKKGLRDGRNDDSC
jgi:hypothetical protein